MGTTWKQQSNGVCWEESSLLAEAGLRHGVAGRTGGVSRAPFASLNLALHVGDEAEAVMENRKRLCRAAHLDEEYLTTGQQTHEAYIVAVGPEDAGRGHDNYDDAFPHTDALMTNCTGIPLILFIADCVPVILFDPVHRACAVVHDGWRGTAARLAAKTVQAMKAAYGSEPQEVLAYIGPSISMKHFEVACDTADVFAAMGPAYEGCIHEVDGHPHVDLWQANRVMLEEAGLKPEHIEVTQSCAYDCGDTCYSYRRDDGKTGRMGAFAVLR